MGLPIQSNYPITATGSNAAIALSGAGLATLTSSLLGAGYNMALVSNVAFNPGGGSYAFPASEGAQLVHIYFSFTLTAPTSTVPFINGGTITIYLIQAVDGTPTISTDAIPAAAGATAAGVIANAPIVQSITIATGGPTTYSGSFTIRNPGPYWTLAVINATGVTFTAASLKYIDEQISTLL